LGELDLVPNGALPSGSDANAGTSTAEQQQQQEAAPTTKQQRPTLRLPSLALSAATAPAASVSIEMANCCQPLLSRDLNGRSPCSNEGTAAHTAVGAEQELLKVSAQRTAGFKAPRRQLLSERPAHRLKAVSYSHAQQRDGSGQPDVAEMPSGVLVAKIRSTNSPPRRRSSSNSDDTHQAAEFCATEGSTSGAQPADVTPPHAAEHRRQSGVQVVL
jgi:hypothetical protein